MEYPESSHAPGESASFHSVVGIDVGSEVCSFCALKPEKSQVIKPTEFVNAAPGFALLTKK